MAFFGIGAGNFDLQITSTEASPGGEIHGTVVLSLNTDVKANGVIMEFWGERKAQVKDAKGKVRAQTVVVYKQTNKLDEERLYQKDETPRTYPFSFKIPVDINRYQTASTAEGAGVPGGSAASGDGPVMWFVKVRLDVPFSFEVSRKKQVTILAAPPAAPNPMQ